ncbi:DNA-binding transcriptional regulator Cro [Nitrosospira sp. Nsp11]|uniref:Cro/CI family transcriptional regulator n=1 Tax=Nitrosospira sp. Nsp11 TaxID=1855338 RepID=UPI0009214E42|nr:Cro/CI family transcriptional regulator [Nitrosospira sp. Nsp11]SHL41751.1 DNA-binding transcriptional regulator Cro [Nitrosospira sp. Nsp11]
MNIPDNEIIDALGGSSAVAVLCEVTVGAVSQWKTDGIPKARLMYLKVIRPDIFLSPSKSKEVA